MSHTAGNRVTSFATVVSHFALWLPFTFSERENFLKDLGLSLVRCLTHHLISTFRSHTLFCLSVQSTVFYSTQLLFLHNAPVKAKQNNRRKQISSISSDEFAD